MKIFVVDSAAKELMSEVRLVKEIVPDCELKSFQSSLEALGAARETEVDVALVSTKMPELEGLDLGLYLKEMYPFVNIIYLSDSRKLCYEALEQHASGYLLKPADAEGLRRELGDLRHALGKGRQRRVFAQTFGNFELFVDGETLHFSRKPAKELLAYLVDRKGSAVTRKELCSVLLQDEAFTRKSQDYLTKIVKELQKTLDEVNAGSIVNLDRSEYSVIPDNFSCDAYDYLKGVPNAFNNFYGEYMSQYPWAEKSIQQFYK